ncbi:aminoacyltransferase [Leuconostoc falkenbergense]|uniref:aminoacyltransferase n=1 Tax=Leuconostoc falkenbergense TaxID=2766470 RepID=UPI0024ADB089|nr:aminoacyltransferase [Leuconostoc falkenbergense]MDI6667984.1 aminoacyltransferase [Leuconostoc falkenbergense]
MGLEFLEINLEEYDAFERQHVLGTYTQSANQYKLLQMRNTQSYLVGIKEKEKLIAAGLISTATSKFGPVFMFDNGPLIDFDNEKLLNFFIVESKKFAKKHGVLYIQWTPNLTYAETNNKGEYLNTPNDEIIHRLERYGFKHEPFQYGMSTAGSPTWEYIKKLDDVNNEIELLKSYTKNVQYYLKKNKEFGVEVRQLDKSDLVEFKNLTQATANRLHYHDKDLEFYQTLYDIYGDQAFFLFAELNFVKYINEEQQKYANLEKKLENIQSKIEKYPTQKKFKRQYAEFDDQLQHHLKRISKAKEQRKLAGQDTVVVAGALFIEQPQEITYLYSGTYETYMDYYGPYQIQNVMLNKAVEHGIKRYNFYGIAGKFDGSDGVLGFKTAFNGYARQLVGNFTMPVNPIKYKIYRLLKTLIGRG